MSKFLDYTGLQDLINKIKTALSSKQDKLISGTNIKTINSTSLLGSGNITVGNVVGDGVSSIVSLTQSEYEALSTKDSATLYIVTPDAGPTNYLKLSGTTFSPNSQGTVTEIGSGYDISDLTNNPPIVYDANGNELTYSTCVNYGDNLTFDGIVGYYPLEVFSPTNPATYRVPGSG